MFISLWCTESPVTSYARVSLLGLTLEPPFGKTKIVVRPTSTLFRESVGGKIKQVMRKQTEANNNKQQQTATTNNNKQQQPVARIQISSATWTPLKTRSLMGPGRRAGVHCVGACCSTTVNAWIVRRYVELQGIHDRWAVHWHGPPPPTRNKQTQKLFAPPP